MSNNDITNQDIHLTRIHGQSGSLDELLRRVGSPSMRNLEDVLEFRKNYSTVRQKMLDNSVTEIESQIPKMEAELNKLINEKDRVIEGKLKEQNETIVRLESELMGECLEVNFFKTLCLKVNQWRQKSKLKSYKNKSKKVIDRDIGSYDKRILNMTDRVHHTKANIQTLAEKAVSVELQGLDQLMNVINKENYLIYGAIGEAKVLSELKKLPKTYHVINNFREKFQPPIYNRGEDDRIYSIQVDHLVVGPTGVFVIETKYWSDKSISNETLFSPVKQVKRAGFALFVILNEAVKDGWILGLVDHWGERKISPKQIVASVNNVPHTEFQYVKVLRIEKLNSYITYGKQKFTDKETQEIVNYLLARNS